MNEWRLKVALYFATIISVSAPAAEFQTAFTYQGRLLDNGVPVTGPVAIDFLLYDDPLAGNLQAFYSPGPVQVANGLFTAELDFPVEVFDGQERWLQVEVNGIALTPRQRISPVPYASQTRGLFVNQQRDVGVNETDPLARLHVQETDRSLAGGMLWEDDLIVEGSHSRIGLYSDGVGPYGSAITFAELGGGSLQDKWALVQDGKEMHFSYSATDPTANIGDLVFRLNGDGWASLGDGSGADYGLRMDAHPYGSELSLFTNWSFSGDFAPDVLPTIELAADADPEASAINGPTMTLYRGDLPRIPAVELRGGSGSLDPPVLGGKIRVFHGCGAESVLIAGQEAQDNSFQPISGGQILVRQEGQFVQKTPDDIICYPGADSILLDGTRDRILILPNPNQLPGEPPAKITLNGSAGGGGGLIQLGNSADKTTVTLDADHSDNSAYLELLRGDGTPAIELGAASERIRLYDNTGTNVAIGITGTTDGGSLGALMTMKNGQGNKTVELDADETSNSAALTLNRSDGSRSLYANAEQEQLYFYDDHGTNVGVVIDGTHDDGSGSGDVGGGAIFVYDKSGNAVITLDSQFGSDGHSRIISDVIEIKGADVAEKFPMSEDAEPGMVVAIDPDNPGKLCLSRNAYNRRVAGVISGANDFSMGAVLGSVPGHEDAPPVALSGRVYVWCDASNGAIQPGDLLTTSGTVGHAMKVADHHQAQGAILGKAMTGLDDGKGLVLVLVSLQ